MKNKARKKTDERREKEASLVVAPSDPKESDRAAAPCSFPGLAWEEGLCVERRRGKGGELSLGGLPL